MKEFKDIHEEEICKSSEEEIAKDNERYTITIVDNQTNETLLNEKTNMVAGVVHMPNMKSGTKGCFQQFCSMSCNGVVVKHSIRALQGLEAELLKSILKGIIMDLEDK